MGCSGIGALLGEGCPGTDRDEEMEGGRGWVGEQAGGREVQKSIASRQTVRARWVLMGQGHMAV